MTGPEQISRLAAAPPPTGTICAPDWCVAADAETADMTPYQEARLDCFGSTAQEWQVDRAQARTDADVMFSCFQQAELAFKRASHDRHTGMRVNRVEFTAPDNSGNISKNDYMIMLRNQMIGKLREGAATACNDRPIADVLLNGNAAELTSLHEFCLQHLANTQARIEVGDITDKHDCVVVKMQSGIKLTNPYATVFTRELIARCQLALLAREMPEALSSLVQPDQLPTLDPAMQRLIAIDIQSSDKSIVLDFVRKQGDKDVSFFEYISNNHLSDQARELAQAIKLGSSAVGDCDCPINALGLCREVAERIDEAKLPGDIKQDMQNKRSENIPQTLLLLRQFGEAQKGSPYWLLDADISPRQAKQASATSRKRNPAKRPAPLPNFEKSLVASIDVETEPVLPTTLAVSWRGADALRIVEANDEAELERLLNDMAGLPIIERYVRTHQHVDMGSFIMHGLRTIFTAPNFRDVRGLRRLVDGKPIRTDFDSYPLTQWKLSGNDMVIGMGGKAVRDTRIFFGFSGKYDQRRIDLRSINNKSDTAHDNRLTSRFA